MWIPYTPIKAHLLFFTALLDFYTHLFVNGSNKNYWDLNIFLLFFIRNLFFYCFSLGSLSRTMVQESTGGKTLMASAVSVIMLLAVILFIGPFFYHLPRVNLIFFFLCKYIYFLVCLSFSLLMWRPVYLSVCISFCMPAILHVWSSAFLSGRLLVFLLDCVSFSLFFFFSICHSN